VTGDLDKQKNRDGRSGKNLGTGLTGCDGGVEGRLREEVFSPTFLLLSSARPKSSRSYNICPARHPSRTPIGLGRSAPRLDGSGPWIVKVEQQFHFPFLDKWIYFSDLLFLDYKIVLLLQPKRRHGGTCCDCLQFLSSGERRHSMKIGVSIGTHGRRAPGSTFALKCPK
jgi:hypothetical protein